ncbi:S8 family serine peptidase [Flammeovirga yaeyamensis]|uniref:S8 family serine peptidase n=1 Tax=Flammeovirga yaeyamensis TaxID=367791 RepID=A0AAX1NET5_9BACT|nr:S8 family serine peptidase [Flammeovirga yaeyamensis]MBB3697249.1 subtilisin family serine protease [Flammeovirga yaeyamensis]NMF33907.1 S8 family serine peptidase [Flammeovirga yaeyamensis]QWG04833.1 S8 family serine peptidase [Flammeovirga yaeyamensis]
MKKLLILLFLSIGFAFSTFGQQNQPSGDDIVSGKIRVKFTKDAINTSSNLRLSSSGNQVGIAHVDDVNQQAGIYSIRRVFPFSTKHEAKHREYGLHLWYEIDFDTLIDPYVMIENYKGLSEVDIVKPVYTKVNIDNGSQPVLFKQNAFKATNTQEEEFKFDDPLLTDQWHYINHRQIGGEYHMDINLEEGWEVTSGSSNIIVAIVDQGVDPYHEDLVGNMWVNEAEMNGTPGEDSDGNGYVDDVYGYNFIVPGPITPGDHGTHVAGTVGAVNNNGVGVAGVAGGDGSGNGVKLMSCQVFDYRERNGNNFAEAIVYGADNGAVISQNSWGYNVDNYYEPEVLEAIRYFVAEAGQYEGSPMKGGILFFAAGNTGTEMQNKYPGAFDEVVAVSALGPSGLPSYYTTSGDWIDIAAPGGDMLNFDQEGGILSTLTNNNYGYMEGTSMACPHVSGVAALVISKFGGDDFTADDLKRILLNSVVPFTFQHNDKFGRGVLNAANALVDDNRIPPNAIDDLTAAEILHNEVTLEWTVPEDEDSNGPGVFYLAFSTEEITEENFNNQLIFGIENNMAEGDTFRVRFNQLLKKSDYWFAVKSVDQFSNLSEISNILKLTTVDEPHFMSNTNQISVFIDVEDQTTVEAPLEFSNIGDGAVYWAAMVTNEHNYHEEYGIETQTASVAQEEVNEVLSMPLNFNNEVNLNSAGRTMEIPTSMEVTEVSEAVLHSNEHWKNDVTEYVSGMSYELYEGPSIIAGSGNPNAGLIFATRFHIPYDYEFNLTHIELGMIPTVSDKPFFIEIRKGGYRNLLESEVVYTQEYYPDTVDVMKYYRMPLYQPQFFDENETFWAVIHFPKEIERPLLLQFGFIPSEVDNFIVSRDNGRTYESSLVLSARSTIPLLRVLSTGSNGSFVFIDPTSGKIESGETSSVTATVDAQSLTNGKHLASLGILTNDIHKPIVNIEVEVNVTGHSAAIDLEKQYELECFTNVEKEHQIILENTGLGDLLINGYEIDGQAVTLEDPITVEAKSTQEFSFPFTISSDGIHRKTLILDTDAGKINVPLTVMSVVPPTLNVTLEDTDIDIDYGTTKEVTLTLENTGSQADLEYDLTPYSQLALKGGVLPEALSYSIKSAPFDGKLWDELQQIGKDIDPEVTFATYDFGMEFPFFNEKLSKFDITYNARIFLYNYIACSPIDFEDGFQRAIEMKYHAYGDKFVVSMKTNHIIYENSKFNIRNAELEYQIVFYRNGLIEYNYVNVENIDPETRYRVYTLGFTTEDTLMYKDFDDDALLLKNGTTVAFEPSQDINMVFDVEPYKGVVAPGNSVDLKVTLDPEFNQQINGTYQNSIVVSSNTVEGLTTVPFTVNVHGEPEMSAVDSVLFADVKIGLFEKNFIHIENTGSAAVTISSIAINNDVFSFDNELIGTEIKGQSNFPLPIIYTPTSNSKEEAVATVTFSDGNITRSTIIGEGIFDADYSHNFPSEIVVDATIGEVENVDVYIQNESNGVDFEYVIQEGLFTSLRNESINDVFDSTTFGFMKDDYGYTWHTSNEENNFYRWENIKGENVLPVEDNKPMAIGLPFDFPFYGGEYDSIWVSIHGMASVLPMEEDFLYQRFEKEDGVSGILAPFWSYLKYSGTDSIYYKVTDDRMLVQWNNFIGKDATSSPGILSFGLEIVKDGRIYFHYKKLDTWGGLLKYGLESPDEKYTLEDESVLIVNQSYLTNRSSIAIVPPVHHKASANAKDNYVLSVNTSRYNYNGTYFDTLRVRTNSDIKPLIEVPVKVNVTGSPELSVLNDVDFDEVVYKENLSISDEIQLMNIGNNDLEVTKITRTNLEAANFFDEDGNQMIMNSSGTLLSPIVIQPWEVVNIKFVLPVSEKSDVNGQLNFINTTGEASSNITAKLVDSPVFVWDATDQEYTMRSTDTLDYKFSIENNGESKLKYSIIPAVLPEIDPTVIPGAIEEIGEITRTNGVVVDSLALDRSEEADGVFTPFVVGAKLGFANRFVAPSGGFDVTHVKVYSYIQSINEYVRIMIHQGGDLPQEGQLLLDQRFKITEKIDEDWMYFKLDQPFHIPEGETFFIGVALPVAPKYMGFNSTEDRAILDNCYSGVYGGEAVDGKYNWWQAHGYEKFAWKIRPLTASGENNWLSLDQKENVLLQGGQSEVTATVNASGAKPGENVASIIVLTNDAAKEKDIVKLKVNVNGRPEFLHTPNSYQDTLRVSEDGEYTFNYLFEDPEGDAMSIQVDSNDIQNIVYHFQQDGAQTASLKVIADYESEGLYHLPISVTDEFGNTTVDTTLIEVTHKNRSPMLNMDYAIIRVNLADTVQAITISPDDLFNDPDDDELLIYAGNYTPDIVDLSLGQTFININPIQEGVGQLVFAADDGKENGFVAYLIYVEIIDDPSAVMNSTDKNGQPMHLDFGTFDHSVVYPNPVTDGKAVVAYKVDENTGVEMELVDINGQTIFRKTYDQQEAGLYSELLPLKELSSGMYILKLNVDKQFVETHKIIIK